MRHDIIARMSSCLQLYHRRLTNILRSALYQSSNFIQNDVERCSSFDSSMLRPANFVFYTCRSCQHVNSKVHQQSANELDAQCIGWRSYSS